MNKRKLGSVLDETTDSDQPENNLPVIPMDQDKDITLIESDPVDPYENGSPIISSKNRVPGNVSPVGPDSVYEGRIKSSDNKRWGVLITAIQGHRYTTEHYYSSYIGKNDSTYSHGQSSTQATNQYTRISGVELKLDDPMPNYAIDQNGKVTYSGTATTPCLFIPNNGDLFTAYVDRNVLYLFRVIGQVRKNTIFDQAAYTFDFVSVENCNLANDQLKDLESKVVSRKVFTKNLTNYNENAILTEEDYGIYLKLMRAKTTLAEDYRDFFFDRNINSLLIPSQTGRCYDPFLVKAFLTIRDASSLDIDSTIDELNCQDTSIKQVKTIWDVLSNGGGSMKAIVKKMALVPKTRFPTKAYFRTVRYADVDSVISPMGSYDNKRLYEVNSSKVMDGNPLKVSSTTPTGTDIEVGVSEFGEKLPLINPVETNGYYIFSESFYENQDAKSQIEYLLLQIINQRVITPKLIDELVTDCYSWGDVEFFYYIPIILYLIEQVLTNGI